MKKKFFSLPIVFVVLALMLAACSNASSSSNASTSGSTSSSADQLLKGATQLLVGTFKLEGTQNAVDSKEAADLLPLWQAYSQLIKSDTAAQAEIDAVLAQIQSTMTASQVQSIKGLKLTQQDLSTTLDSLGMAGAQSNAGGTSSANSTPASLVGTGNADAPGGAAGSPPGAGSPPETGGDSGLGSLLAGSSELTSST